jgi:hypothetical protein
VVVRGHDGDRDHAHNPERDQEPPEAPIEDVESAAALQ